jgi:hypothetical protein
MQPTREKREGLAAVKYLMSKGIPVKPFFAKGEDGDERSYSLDLALPQEEQKERYKVCLIGRLLCLDIDRKKGIDGIINFYAYLERLGITKEMLPLWLQDIEKESYPFYMATPSGGLHLYFKYYGKCPEGKLCDGVEIKNKQLAAGYNKDGKTYILYGNIEDMQRIPMFLLEKIIPKEVNAAQKKWKRLSPFPQRQKERPSVDKIVEWTDKDGKGTEGRNARAFSLAFHLATHGYSSDETMEILTRESELPLSELLVVVKSAYKRLNKKEFYFNDKDRTNNRFFFKSV